MIKILKASYYIVIASLFVSCSTSKRLNKDFTYFQRGMDSLGSSQFKEPLIQPSDVLSIQIFSSSLSQEQAAVFNIANGSSPASGNSNNGISSSTVNNGMATSNNSGYLVSLDGDIEMPIIGTIKAAGLTKHQLSQAIVKKLDPYVKLPNVIVKITSFKVNVLGEVSRPGPVYFNNDRANILEAIALAGDLKDDGNRNQILVIREEGGKRTSHTVDLRSGAIFKSPVFQLQQNDIIYVTARNIKLRSLNSDPNSQRNTSIIFASVSALAVLLQVIIILFKK